MGVLVTRAELFKLLPFGLAGRARIEGGWFDRILWAGKHSGFVLLDSSFKNLATSLRISSAETFLSVDLLSFFSLESSWREVLPPRPLPPYPMTDFTFKHARVRVGTQILELCFWAG